MGTFLLKTEPSEYSFGDLVKAKSARWDGVTNPQACAAIRQIRKGDELLIYHTGDEKAIVGLARATSGPYEDPDAPGLTAAGEIKRPVFDLRAVKPARTVVPLGDIKADARFAKFPLVTNSRLSAMAVPDELAAALRDLTGL